MHPDLDGLVMGWTTPAAMRESLGEPATQLAFDGADGARYELWSCGSARPRYLLQRRASSEPMTLRGILAGFERAL